MIRQRCLLDSDVALGAAVMLVRGAVERISNALEERNLSLIRDERIYADQVAVAYERSKKTAPPDSIVTERYIRVGDDALKVLCTKSKTAGAMLRSSLCSAAKLDDSIWEACCTYRK